MADHIELVRTIDIDVPAGDVAAAISDFHRWVDWSPFEGADPDLTRTYSGPDSGVGSTYAWAGNRRAGAGRMTVTDASDEAVGVLVHFLRPFRSESRSTFTMTPTATGTRVSWRMTFEKTLIARVMSLVAPYEKILGPDLAKGLANLEAVLTR